MRLTPEIQPKIQEFCEQTSIIGNLLLPKAYFNTASPTLKDQLERTEPGMPYQARLTTKKSKVGNDYMSLDD